MDVIGKIKSYAKKDSGGVEIKVVCANSRLNMDTLYTLSEADGVTMTVYHGEVPGLTADGKNKPSDNPDQMLMDGEPDDTDDQDHDDEEAGE